MCPFKQIRGPVAAGEDDRLRPDQLVARRLLAGWPGVRAQRLEVMFDHGGREPAALGQLGEQLRRRALLSGDARERAPWRRDRRRSPADQRQQERHPTTPVNLKGSDPSTPAS
jgi:hypothetical protein